MASSFLLVALLGTSYVIYSFSGTMIHCDKRILRIFFLLNLIAKISANRTESSKIDIVEETEVLTTTRKELPDKCLVKMGEQGPCKQYIYKWTFNKIKGECQTFIYGGCLGNENRFNSEDECLHYCVGGPDRKLFKRL